MTLRPENGGPLSQPLATAERVSVLNDADANRVGRKARQLARSIGFAAVECDEIALAATELASNLVRHAGGGELILEPLSSCGRLGIQIVSEDRGPGFADTERALTDGFSTAGGLGHGLGTIHRFMDVLETFPRAGGGAQVVCERWLRPVTGRQHSSRLEFGVATRSYRFQPENGDAFVIQQWEARALAGVIDGLGHGQFARRASHAAKDYLDRHFDQPLEALFRGVSRACRATRGVVMALARFELDCGQVQLASVGNVETHLLGSPRASRIVVRRGVVGMSDNPAPVATSHPWTGCSLLILHSDGIQTHWLRSEIESLKDAAPSLTANQLLERYSRRDDDATIIVARNARS